MPPYELDHLTLGARHLYASCEHLRTDAGLDSVDGGWQRTVPTAHRIIPLPGDSFLHVESVIDHQAPLAPPEGAFRHWFDEALADGEDRWMTWCLRVDSYAELERIAARFDSEISASEGAIRPNGTVEARVMAPTGSAHPWLRGLPNWYYYADMARHPSRTHHAAHRTPLSHIAWLEVGGEPSVYEEHLGAETVEHLRLRFVDRPTGLYGLGIATADGEEVAIRRDSAAPALGPIMSGLLT